MARKSAPLQCSESELDELLSLIQNADQPRIAERATLVLEFIKGRTITEIAERHSAQPNTVIKWKRRYAAQGIEGLLNLPRGSTKDAYGKDFKKRLIELVHCPPDTANYSHTQKRGFRVILSHICALSGPLPLGSGPDFLYFNEIFL